MTIYYSHAGGEFDPDLKTYLFIHGAGCEQSLWSGQSRYLARQNVNVIVVDLPYHGLSKKVGLNANNKSDENAFSISDMAEFLLDFCHEQDIKQLIPVGHSMGALIALNLAKLAHEDKDISLSGLVLMGVGAVMPVHPNLLNMAYSDPYKAAEMIASWGLAKKALMGGAKLNGASLFATVVNLMGRQQPNILGHGLKACADWQGAVSDIEALPNSLPIAFILGKQDRMTPAKSATPLIELAGNAQTIILDEVGHMMMLEAPIETKKAFMRHVEML